MRMFLAMLVLWPVWALADTDDFILGLYRLERCGFMSSSETASAARIDICRDMLEEVDGIFRALAEEEQPELIDRLTDGWDALRDLYDQTLDDASRFRDHYTVDEVRLNRTALTDILRDRLPIPPNPMALAVLMERASTEYIWRAEAAMAGGLSATEILDIESMVMEMDKQFVELRKRYPQDISLRHAYSRYQFIRGSMLNYNTDTVPYLVDRYATSITAALSKVVRK
ncbi:MAG: hypothetical protein ACK4SX_01440 [Alcanivoracaceae bacterium]